MHNYKSATDNPYREKVEGQIKHEISAGNYVITSSKPTIISALGAIPKGDSDDIRLIHDCSRPVGAGVNAYATCDHYEYESVQRATKLIKPGAFLAKIDLKSAYRHVPIHPSNYHATGLKWTFTGCTKPTYLFDTKLPFGARRSPGVFHRLTQSVTRMMARRGFTVLAYLDDFLIIADTEQTCWAAFRELCTLLTNLGFTINWTKVNQPTQSLTYLGIHIDSVRRQLTLPESKLSEIKEALQAAINKTKLTKRELQCLAGRLNFAARVIYGGRTFLRRLIDSINTLKRPHHHTRLTQTLRKDLYWWIEFMDTFNGITFFVDWEPQPLDQFSTDACLTGGAGHFHQDWFYVNWALDHPQVQEYHINKLELYTVLLSLRRWQHQMRNKWMVVYTDNTVTLYALNKGSSRCPETMAWLREMFWISARNNFRLTACYVTSRTNVVADTLSRLHDPQNHCKFLDLLNTGTIQCYSPHSHVSSNALSAFPLQDLLQNKNLF